MNSDERKIQKKMALGEGKASEDLVLGLPSFILCDH